MKRGCVYMHIMHISHICHIMHIVSILHILVIILHIVPIAAYYEYYTYLPYYAYFAYCVEDKSSRYGVYPTPWNFQWSLLLKEKDLLKLFPAKGKVA